jgi:hypothetical protein
MKRLTLLTILLVVVGLTAGFSLELKPSFTLAATGKVTWGIDLDTGWTGFLNEQTVDLYVIMFANELTDTHAGEGDWYGSITVKDIELWWYADEAHVAQTNWTYADTKVVGDVTAIEKPAVSAKIVGLGGDLAIGVYGGPDTGSNVDFVASIEDDDFDNDYPVVDDEATDEWDLGVNYDNYGTYVSYALGEMLTVGLEAVTPVDYNANSENAYAFALDVLATFSPITVTAGVTYGIGYDAAYVPAPTAPLDLYVDVFGLGLKVAADTDMIDGWVGFDAGIGDTIGASGADFQFEVGGNVTVTLFEVTTLALNVTYGPGYQVVGFDDLDFSVVFTEPAAKGLVDNLDLTIKAWVLDVPDDLEWEVNVDGGYLMGVWYPNFTVDAGQNANGAAYQADELYVKALVGIDYKAIPLTTLSMYWKNIFLMGSPESWGDFVIQAKVAY